MTLTEVKDALLNELKEMAGLVEKQQKEIKEYGATTKETAEKIEKHEKLISELSAEVKAKEEELKKLYEEQEKRIVELEAKEKRVSVGGNGESKSLGELFIESAEFKEMKRVGSYTSAPYRFKSFFDFEKKAITSSITGGLFGQAFRVPEIVAPGVQALRIRDLLSVQPTTSGAIEYVVETGFTNSAAPVAENNSKPESNLTFELKTEAIKTVAHWIPVSRQVLDDVAQLRSYIDTRMIYGLKAAEEAQILYGNGVSPNLNGIIPQATSYTQLAGDTKIDAVRKAITVAEIAGYPVNGIVMHPSDFEEIELAKDSQGRYLWIVVSEGGVKRLFAVPVVVTTAINQGEALVGAFNLGATLWDRQEAQIRVSEEHADYFIKNMVAILAEERVTLTVFRPQAFVAITFESGS